MWMASPFLYDARRFAGVKLSTETTNLLAQKAADAINSGLNRKLLQDAYPVKISSKKQFMCTGGKKSLDNQPMLESMVVENARSVHPPLDYLWLDDGFVLRRPIGWLFRERVSRRKSAIRRRNDELKSRGPARRRIAHHSRSPRHHQQCRVLLQRGLKEAKRFLAAKSPSSREEIERSDRILINSWLRAIERRAASRNLIFSEEPRPRHCRSPPPATSYDTQSTVIMTTTSRPCSCSANHIPVMLVNLLQNAREALVAAATSKSTPTSATNNTLQIVISDDGPGILSTSSTKSLKPTSPPRKRHRPRPRHREHTWNYMTARCGRNLSWKRRALYPTIPGENLYHDSP